MIPKSHELQVCNRIKLKTNIWSLVWYNDEHVLFQQIVQTLIKCHTLQHFILVFTVCLNLIIIAKPKYIHLIWGAKLLSPALYLFYVNLYWNKLYVLRLWINTFSPYPQFPFFPPQIYLNIQKWEKQEYTGATVDMSSKCRQRPKITTLAGYLALSGAETQKLFFTNFILLVY